MKLSSSWWKPGQFFQMAGFVQNKESLKAQWKWQDWKQTVNWCLWDFQGDGVLWWFPLSTVSSGSKQHFIAGVFAFETWMMAQVLSHTKSMCLRSHLFQNKMFPCPVGMPMTLLPEACTLAEGVSCSTGNLAADSAFQSFCQQHCPFHQKIMGGGAVFGWDVDKRWGRIFSLYLWFFAKGMWYLSWLAIKLCAWGWFSNQHLILVGAQC